LENRVIEEIVSNTNIDEIKISESLFNREEQVNIQAKENEDEVGQLSSPPICNLRKERTTFQRGTFEAKPKNASYLIEESFNSENKEQQIIDKDKGRIHSWEELKEPQTREIDSDFLDLQMTVEQDISEWSRICKTNSVVVYRQ